MTWNFIHFSVIDSTSKQARRRINIDKARGNEVIYANNQTASYGRRGRPWVSASGNLFASAIIKKPDNIGQIPFVFGLALYDALNSYADETQILKLKWPNDILLNDYKLAGVLLEVDRDFLIIGFGVNLVVAPQGDQPMATLGTKASAKEVLETTLNNFDKYQALWLDKGFAPIRKIWMESAHGLGKTVVARFPDGTEKSGIFENISHDGALVIRNDNEEQEIPTADIFFGS